MTYYRDDVKAQEVHHITKELAERKLNKSQLANHLVYISRELLEAKKLLCCIDEMAKVKIFCCTEVGQRAELDNSFSEREDKAPSPRRFNKISREAAGGIQDYYDEN